MCPEGSDPCAPGTIPAFLRTLVDRFGDKRALFDEESSLTYRDLDIRSGALAREFLGLGVGKYGRVGIVMPNSVDWVVAWFAACRIGAVAVPISTFSSGRELQQIVDHADCQVLVVKGSRRGMHPADLLSEQLTLPRERSADGPHRLPELPHLRWILEVDESDGQMACSTETRAAARECVSDDLLAGAERSVHPSDPATMIYTSGSTNAPKGVIHSHRGVMTQAAALRDDLQFEEDGSTFTSMPFFWVGGLGLALLPTLAAGGSQAILSSTDPAQILRLIQRQRLTRVLIYPPRLLARVIEHPAYATADISSVRRGTPGIPRNYTPEMSFSRTRDGLQMGLGMSETFGPYWWGDPIAPEDLATPPLRRASPGWSVKVVREDGAPAGENERGEIRVRGPNLTIGLQKIERPSVFDEDGYYRTGDVGLVEGGEPRFRGRSGDVIKVNGANVSIAEVTAALERIGGVAGAFVGAVPDEERGAVVGAAVVAEQGVELSASSLRIEVEADLARFKVPAILLVCTFDDVPMTATGKLDRRKFAELMLAERATADGVRAAV